MPTQLPSVPSLIPSSFATLAIGRDVSITIFTASSLNSGEKLFFGRGNYFTFPDIHPNGWTVRKPRGTSLCGIGGGFGDGDAGGCGVAAQVVEAGDPGGGGGEGEGLLVQQRPDAAGGEADGG